MIQDVIQNLQLATIGPLQVSANLLVTLVLAILTTFVYRHTHSGYAYSRSFSITMISVAMVVAMMMMVIGSYLALSLGLIGALSVIRFRTAVKDPKDMAYLFICIAIGLSCSTGDFIIAVVGTLFINITLLVLHFLRFGAVANADFVLTFILDSSFNSSQDALERAIQKFPKMLFRSCATLTQDQDEYVYTLSLGTQTAEQCIHFFHDEIPEFKNLSLIAPETTIET